LQASELQLSGRPLDNSTVGAIDLPKKGHFTDGAKPVSLDRRPVDPVACLVYRPRQPLREFVTNRQADHRQKPDARRLNVKGSRVPVFRSIEDVAGWLAGQPRDVAVVFAARAALRIIPVLASQFGLHGRQVNKAQSATVLRVFRCVAAAWAAAAYPGRSAELRPAAAVAGSRSDDKTASTAESAASWASAAAGALDADRFPFHAVTYATDAAAAGGSQAFDDILNSYAADAEIIDHGYSPVTLALSSTLWRSTPDWAFEGWAELEGALLGANEDWEVWTDWYEARLKAGEADPVLETARATIPDETWKRASRVVNSQIKSWIEERQRWHYATQDEREIEDQLVALSLEELAIIGMRVALRSVPLLTLGGENFTDPEFGQAILLMFRALALAWTGARYPHVANHERFAQALTAAASVENRSVNTNTGFAVANAAISATVASALNPTSSPAAGTVVLAIRILRSAAIRAEGDSAKSAFDGNLARDLEAFGGAARAGAVAELPLWSESNNSGSSTKAWNALKRGLIHVGQGWEAWVDWYESRLTGRPRFVNREFAYVEVPDALWADGPVSVNAWILRRIRELELAASTVDSVGGEARSTVPPRLEPLIGVPSAFGFGWTAAGTITAVSGSANWPVFPLPTSQADHRNRLEACRTIAKDVISALKAQRYNARPEFADVLTKYHKRLPKAPGTGNILLADAEARRLRDLWVNDLDSVSAGLASLLKIFLEQHIGLRPYYPEIEKFYHDVQTGRIETPLPQDAVDGFVKGIRDNTPAVFDESVTSAIDISAQAAPLQEAGLSSPGDAHPADTSQPMPPTDPLKELNPRKARDYTFGGIVNAVWKTYLEGEKLPKAAKGWKEAGEALQPYVGSILDWLRSFTGS